MVSKALEQFGEGFIELRKIEVSLRTPAPACDAAPGGQGDRGDHVQVTQRHLPARRPECAHGHQHGCRRVVMTALAVICVHFREVKGWLIGCGEVAAAGVWLGLVGAATRVCRAGLGNEIQLLRVGLNLGLLRLLVHACSTSAAVACDARTPKRFIRNLANTFWRLAFMSGCVTVSSAPSPHASDLGLEVLEVAVPVHGLQPGLLGDQLLDAQRKGGAGLVGALVLRLLRANQPQPRPGTRI